MGELHCYPVTSSPIEIDQRIVDSFIKRYSWWQTRGGQPLPTGVLLDCFILSNRNPDYEFPLKKVQQCMHSIWSGGLRVTANNYHQHWLKMWSTRHYEFSWQDMAEEAVVSGDWKKKSENYEFKKCVSLDEMAETAALELNEEWVQDCYGFLSGSSGLVQGETINLDDKLKIGSRLLVMDSVRKSTNRKNKQGSFYPTSKHGVDLWALDYVDDSEVKRSELFRYENRTQTHKDGDRERHSNNGLFLETGVGSFPENPMSLHASEFLVAEELPDMFDQKVIENRIQRSYYNQPEPRHRRPNFKLIIEVDEYPKLFRLIDKETMGVELKKNNTPTINSYLNAILYLVSMKMALNSQARGWNMWIQYRRKRCFDYDREFKTSFYRIDGLKKDAESLSLKLRSELAELFFMTENDMGESGNVNMPLNPVELLLKVSDQKIMQEYDERGKGIYLTLDLAKSSNGTFISGFVGNESRSIKEDETPKHVARTIYDELFKIIEQGESA